MISSIDPGFFLLPGDCLDRSRGKSGRSASIKKYYEKNKCEILRKNKLVTYRRFLKDPISFRRKAREAQVKWMKKKPQTVLLINRRVRERRMKNPTKFAEAARRHYLRNSERIKLKARQYAANNRTKINLRVRARRAASPTLRLESSLRSRISECLSRKKKATFLEFIGCSVSELEKHLEYQFRNGMSWDNYGKSGWQVDHIKPCRSFNFALTEEQLECFHFTNLQPLWASENYSKGDKVLIDGVVSRARYMTEKRL